MHQAALHEAAPMAADCGEIPGQAVASRFERCQLNANLARSSSSPTCRRAEKAKPNRFAVPAKDELLEDGFRSRTLTMGR